MNDTKTKLATAYEGEEGHPGDSYELIRARLYCLASGRFQCLVHAESGSNQGHLEAHNEADLEGRGNTITEAIDAVRDDVEEWDDWLSSQERHQLLRTLEYEAEDAELQTEAE